MTGQTITTRRVALIYLPTVGAWSLVRAITWYRRDVDHQA